ncbi:sodium transport protein [Brachyspira sp. CAG:484]|nr:sodium transport protein [Brachyspira sp. CAG:484]
MRLSYLANAISLIMMYIGMVILSPIIIALIYHDFYSVIPFLCASIISSAGGFIIRKLVPQSKELENLNDIKKAEALFIVAVSWIIFGIMCAIPYLFYGLSPLDSLFESVSGITTTGATILTNFDYPKAFFFWRSLTQWLGGLGIIVLFIAILPQFAVAGRQMFFAEAPGPTEDKFTPRIRNTASALWKVYAGLTLLQVILLVLAGMPVFDAVCNSFSTLAAGGFSPNAQSTMGYHSNYITWIILIFMFFAGSSFNLQYKVIMKKNPLLFFKNEEFRAYLIMTLVFSSLIAIVLITENNYSIFGGITHALYQVISIATSTGSASVDFAQWDFTAKVLLFLVMFMGSCSSSAGGGIKMTRWVLVAKSMKAELMRILHPNAVFNIKIDNNNVPPEVVRQIIVFVFFYFLVFALIAVIITLTEQNATIGLTGSITALGNIGPGFGKIVGPMGSFSSIHSISKALMVTGMLVGRLELMPFLVMFQRDFWSFKEN